jgi:hypothetical protein
MSEETAKWHKRVITSFSPREEKLVPMSERERIGFRTEDTQDGRSMVFYYRMFQGRLEKVESNGHGLVRNATLVTPEQIAEDPIVSEVLVYKA